MTRHHPQYSTALEIAVEVLCSLALSCVLFLLLIGVLL
jgi:hypothetical protein